MTSFEARSDIRLPCSDFRPHYATVPASVVSKLIKTNDTPGPVPVCFMCFHDMFVYYRVPVVRAVTGRQVRAETGTGTGTQGSRYWGATCMTTFTSTPTRQFPPHALDGLAAVTFGSVLPDER